MLYIRWARWALRRWLEEPHVTDLTKPEPTGWLHPFVVLGALALLALMQTCGAFRLIGYGLTGWATRWGFDDHPFYDFLFGVTLTLLGVEFAATMSVGTVQFLVALVVGFLLLAWPASERARESADRKAKAAAQRQEKAYSTYAKNVDFKQYPDWLQREIDARESDKA